MAPLVNYISEDAKIGKNTKVWHFAFVGKNAQIGDNCVIGSLCAIDRDVKIGNNCRIQTAVNISPTVQIGDGVFIGPHATFTNDPYPPSEKMQGVIVEDNVIIGANATIRSGIRIGKNSVVGMGAVVTRDVPSDVVVIGSPAKIKYSRAIYDKKRQDWVTS